MSKIFVRISVLSVFVATLAGCANPQGNNALMGTGVGAATGAALGAIFGGGRGAAIGAAAGGAVGSLTGYNWNSIKRKLTGGTAGTGTQVTEQPDGSLKVNIPSSISFGSGSYQIKPSFAPILSQVAQTLSQNPGLTAQVVGHTDSTGQAAANQTLSLNRAQSVVSALVQAGIASQRLSANGMGDTQPVATNSTAIGRAMNRRVEIYLRPPASQPAAQ